MSGDVIHAPILERISLDDGYGSQMKEIVISVNYPHTDQDSLFNALDSAVSYFKERYAKEELRKNLPEVDI